MPNLLNIFLFLSTGLNAKKNYSLGLICFSIAYTHLVWSSPQRVGQRAIRKDSPSSPVTENAHHRCLKLSNKITQTAKKAASDYNRAIIRKNSFIEDKAEDVGVHKCPDIIRIEGELDSIFKKVKAQTKRNPRLLELGAGTERSVLKFLELDKAYGWNLELVLVDISSEAIRVLEKNIRKHYPEALKIEGKITFIEADMMKLRLKDIPGGRVDVVTLLFSSFFEITPKQKERLIKGLKKFVSKDVPNASVFVDLMQYIPGHPEADPNTINGMPLDVPFGDGVFHQIHYLGIDRVEEIARENGWHWQVYVYDAYPKNADVYQRTMGQLMLKETKRSKSPSKVKRKPVKKNTVSK